MSGHFRDADARYTWETYKMGPFHKLRTRVRLDLERAFAKLDHAQTHYSEFEELLKWHEENGSTATHNVRKRFREALQEVLDRLRDLADDAEAVREVFDGLRAVPSDRDTSCRCACDPPFELPPEFDKQVKTVELEPLERLVKRDRLDVSIDAWLE